MKSMKPMKIEKSSWKNYFSELFKTIKDYAIRDRKKDSKLVSSDLSNPGITSHSIIIDNNIPFIETEYKCPYPETMGSNDGCTMGACKGCPAFTEKVKDNK